MFQKNEGLSLIDVLVGIGLMLVVFVGLLSAFKVGIQIIGISKIRAGAIALANEQIEFIKNLPYENIGTEGGIPSGSIPQTENLYLNSINYTSRTLIQYVDDPADGEGENDENEITADYKRVKVEISWESKNPVDPVVLISDIVPKGIETTAGGGTLKINVFDALISPVDTAVVLIENNSINPPVSVSILTNYNGKVVFPGTPSSSDYEITVNKTGYNSAQTYDTTTENPNPQPGHLAILEGETTEASFSIDLLSSKTIKTYTPADSYVWTDSFLNENKISATSSVIIADGKAVLASTTDFGYSPSGYLISKTITPAELDEWTEFSWNDSTNASTTIKYHILYFDSVDWSLIPDTDLAGNSTGFAVSPVNLSGVASTTYPEVRLRANLSTIDASTTPSLLDWQISWESSRIPLPSIDFHMRGEKIIGYDLEEQPIYKYSEDLNTDTSGEINITSLEWDNYLISVGGVVTGYDISESCPFQPVSISPGTNNTTEIVLVPHENNTLLVYTKDNSDNFVPNASVRLYKTGYDETLQTSDNCGQVFFSPLSLSNSYTIEVSKTGYQDFSLSNIEIDGQTSMQIILSPL